MNSMSGLPGFARIWISMGKLAMLLMTMFWLYMANAGQVVQRNATASELCLEMSIVNTIHTQLHPVTFLAISQVRDAKDQQHSA